jgi:hypothetical protein
LLDDEAAIGSADSASVASAAVIQTVALTREAERAIGEQTESGDNAVSIGGVTLQPPTGWTVDDAAVDTLILAEQSADIEATAPSGPRITVRAVSTESSPVDGSVSPNDGGALTGKVKVSKTTSHGARAAVVDYTVTKGGTTETIRVVAMTPAEGVAYSFTLEAPRKQVKRGQAALKAVLASVKFDDGAAAPAA